MNEFNILTTIAKDMIRECQLQKMPWYKRMYYRITGAKIK